MAKIDIKKEMGKRLTEARKAAGFNRTEAARNHGWNYDTYKSHESGQRQFDQAQAAIYSRAFNTPINHLLCLDLLTSAKSAHASDSVAGVAPSVQLTTSSAGENEQHAEAAVITVPVHGQAAGGLWLEGDDMPFDSEPDLVPAVAGYPASYQYARRVVGNSVNNRISDGEYAIFVRYDRYDAGLKPGQLVDCQRSRAGLYEHTVKVYAVDSLMTDSRDLEEQTAIPMDAAETDTLVEIVGVAVGAYRPLM
ncbi:MAG: hypothetical protein H5U22_06690 [Rhizobium sp.]|nr:hypothetical protein [Rhizobium sp.]